MCLLTGNDCACLSLCCVSVQYRSLAPMYYRGAAAAIVVYDITDPESFEKMKGWVQELKRLASADIVIAIVGNKCDNVENREVSEGRCASGRVGEEGGCRELYTLERSLGVV